MFETFGSTHTVSETFVLHLQYLSYLVVGLQYSKLSSSILFISLYIFKGSIKHLQSIFITWGNWHWVSGGPGLKSSQSIWSTTTSSNCSIIFYLNVFLYNKYYYFSIMDNLECWRKINNTRLKLKYMYLYWMITINSNFRNCPHSQQCTCVLLFDPHFQALWKWVIWRLQRFLLYCCDKAGRSNMT